MRICYCITGMGLGGAEVITCKLANLMSARGHTVSILYLTGTNVHTDRLDPRIECLGLGMHKTPWGLFKALRRAGKYLKAFRPDVVHAQMVHANLFTRLLRIAGSSAHYLICSEHNYEVGGRIRMLAYRWTDRWSDLNTNVSRDATQRFIREKAFSAHKSLTVYNGVEVDRLIPTTVGRKTVRELYGITDDKILLLNAGRLNEAKDQAGLIDAFAIAATRDDRIVLIIIGQGELQQELQERIERYGLAARIVLAGAHPNVGDYYSAADIFVLSSAWEGLPMVILEAMGYGLPIITTAVGGAEETVANDDWIVPPRDPAALAEAIERMSSLTDDERRGIGTGNREKVRGFDIEQICDQWERIYNSPKATVR